MDNLIGKRIGPYEIRDLIGRGGMATVYRGYQANLNRYVAVKFLADWMSQDTEFVQRFRQEALAAGGLRHPNILTIHDAGVFEGRPYIVMDYVPTGTLADLIKNGPMPPDKAADLAAQIADALDKIHRQGIVHRDMKPNNVLMDEDGRPLVADFGIAQAMGSGPRLTQTGTAVGTPEYMSPEQGQGARVDGRSDIYSLGIILYQMLAGRVPFSASTPMATLYQVVHNPTPPLRQTNPNIPPWLESITLKALTKQPEDRFQSAREMAEALRTRRVTSPSKKALATPSKPTPPVQRRTSPALIIVGGLIGLLLIVGAAIGASSLMQPRPTATAAPIAVATMAPTFTPSATVPATPTPPVVMTVMTPLPTLQNEVLVTTNGEAQIYAGPDIGHPVLITVPKGQQVPVSGRTQDNAWWRITIAGVTAWIANDRVMAPPEALALPVISELPTPPKPPSTPTSPLAETPSATSTSVPPVQALATARTNANLRGGPGENYPIVGRATAGQQFAVTARTPAGDWWQVETAGGTAWISSKVATANAEVAKVATVVSPTQAPTSTSPSVPRPTALPEGPRVAFDFENFGSWRRGNEPYGEFTASGDQKHGGANAGKLTYNIPAVDKNYVVFTRSAPVTLANGAPALTLWVYGDGSGAFLNAWIRDGQGERRAFTFGRVTHTGWQLMTAALDTTLPWPQGHVDGPDNGRLDDPIRLDSFVLDAEPVGAAQGVIYLDDLDESTAASAPQPGGATTPAAPTAPPPPPSALSGHILFTSGNTVHVVDAGTKGSWPLSANGRQPDIRGDARVVFNGVGGGKDNLITVNLDGSRDMITSGHPEDSYPHWSRDGNSAVFHSTLQGDGRQRIYIQRDMSHREEPGKLMVGNTEVFGEYPTWLKSWRIAYTGCDYWAAGGNCGIWTINSDGSGAGVQLTQSTQDRSTDEFGGIVLYSSKASGNWDVYAIPEGGGSARNLTSSPTQDAGATFSPDGRAIAFMSDRGGGWAIWVMNVDGGNPQKLIDVPGGLGAWEEERLAWGP